MKIGIVTQARTESTRLPSKILLEIDNVKLLEFHLKRLIKSEVPVFLATTNKMNDDIIINVCNKFNIPSYRGNENDVLRRFYYCALKFKLDIVIRVTSDCPLIDSNIIENGLAFYLKKYALNKNVYLSNTINRTFPKGMDFEIFSFKMLKDAHRNCTSNFGREHVTPYFYDNLHKKYELVNFYNKKNTSNIRLTIDYIHDYIFIKNLIVKHQVHLKTISQIEDIIYMDSELQNLNLQCKKIAIT